MTYETTHTLAESTTQALLRITSTYTIGGTPYIGVRYEWWHDKAAMERGDYGGGGKIYCSCHAGKVNEVVLVRKFMEKAK